MPPPQDPFAHVEVRVVLPRTILIPRAVQISTTLPLDSEKARLLDPVLVNGGASVQSRWRGMCAKTIGLF